MSLENAEHNLKEFGKELNLEGLAFDENHTCILGIDNTFSLHLTYEPNSDRLYLYSPILDGLPQDTKIRLQLYEALLEGSMLGGQMAGGGIGVATKEELILMHCVVNLHQMLLIFLLVLLSIRQKNLFLNHMVIALMNFQTLFILYNFFILNFFI